MPLVKGETVKTTPPRPAPPPQQTPAVTPKPPVGKGPEVAATEPAAPSVPVKPPSEPPDPVLTSAGINYGPREFVQRAHAARDAFVQQHGYEPPKGLVFDIARSPLLPEQFSPLLTQPSQTAARHQAVIGQLDPRDQLVVRHDGYVEHQAVGAQQTVAPHITTFQDLQKQHPWVAMGMLPIPGGISRDFWDAVQFAQQHPQAAAPLTVGGETLQQYQRENQYGESLTGISRFGAQGMAANRGFGKPADRTVLAEQQYISNRENIARGVTTVQQAQDHLKALAPDFFAHLPSTGYVNSDWATAIGKYQSSALYFRQQTAQLARDNHFGDNTAAFIHAWKAKQAAIQKQPFLRVFLEHQPLAFFDYRTHGAAVAHLFTGDAKGWGWANIPTIGLGALVHTAGVALGEIAGTIDQAKVDASYVSKYMQSILPKDNLALNAQLGWKTQGLTEKQARERAAKVLYENPSWARVFDPQLGEKGDPEAFARKAAPIFNGAVDLLLGAPKFTGERVVAGDLAAAKASRYFNAKTAFAYNALKKGDLGGAVASLEGGLGAERLNTVLEEGVRNGDVSLAQYQHHAAELYAHGTTAIGGRATGTAKAYIANGFEGRDDLGEGVFQRGFSYHRAPSDSFESIREKGLQAAGPGASIFKPAGDEPGVYFASQHPLRARSLSGKSLKGSIFFRVRTTSLRDVSERAFGEHLTPHDVPPEDLEYLGADKQWHPVAGQNPEVISGADGKNALFRSLRGKDLPTTGRTGQAAQAMRSSLRSVIDQWENTLAARRQVGATSNAQHFIASVRQLTARAAPAGSRRAIFDERLPEDMYNWARTQLKATPAEAAQWRDELIRLRAKDDVQGITALADRMRQQFMIKHPDAELGASPVESAGPELESESRTYLTFPASIEARAAKVNAALNKIGRAHRETIVGGSPVPLIPGVFGGIPGFGESLAFKHIFADTTRRVVGGAGLFPVDRNARELVDGFLKENPAAIREMGTARAAAEQGETRYITGQKPTDPLSFRTGDPQVIVKGEKVSRKTALKAAGGYLRRHLSSDALKAYQQSSPDNVQPLVNMILRSRHWRGVLGVGDAAQATEAADMLYLRYREIEEAGQAAGVQDPLNNALDVLVKNKGAHADAALGKWIGDNKIDLPVRDGLVERSQWDDRMQWWIGKLMTANKWNRRQLFDHVFYNTTSDLVGHGWTVEDALPVAADLAKAQTVYHMLDFSNMLQVEQNLRWLSYFATKHRLYWSWILKQGIHRPGLAAPVTDVKQQLDDKGNLDLTIGGRQFYVPAARLFWVNNREYPQTSPLVQLAAEAGKGVVEGHGFQAIPDAMGKLTSTSGNVLTRDDQAWMYAIKLGLISTGHLAASSDNVTAGMPDQQKRYFQEAVNQYAAFYRADHGRWPNEADAVKHVLLAELAQETWRSNLFLPVLWDGQGAPSPRVKALHQQYNQIVSPSKKRQFLDQHPDLALQFGVTQDPAVYLHTGPIWDKFNAAHKWVEQQRQQIWQDILTGGYTPAIKVRMKQLSAAWSQKIDELKLEDAATWQGNQQFPAGKISDGQVVTPGPWGVQLEGDPFAARAFIHNSFPGIDAAELNAHTVGERIVALQDEAARLRAAKTPAQVAKLGYPDEQHVTERLAEINQILAPFFAYPKDAASKAQSLYYNRFVGPYITERDRRAAELKNAPQDQQDALRSEFRAWKDAHDHPVVVNFDGHQIRFPSVVQIGWSTLPADQRHLGLAQAVSGDWSHVASYEKTMLGVKTAADVSQGWAAYYDAIRQYSKVPSNAALVQSQKVGLAKQIDKVYPGFYKDFLFAQQPKIVRFQNTSLYRQMPDQQLFNQVIALPAKQLVRAINQNGSRRYYEKAWRNYIETQVQPWLDQHPELKKNLADFGPDFLNTLVSP